MGSNPLQVREVDGLWNAFLIWLVLAVQGLFIALMLAYLAPWGTDWQLACDTVFTIDEQYYVGLAAKRVVAAERIVWVACGDPDGNAGDDPKGRVNHGVTV